jgi:hypothetical protein
VIEKKNLPKEYGGDVELKEMTGSYISIWRKFPNQF